MTDAVLIDTKDFITTITLNRGDNRNSMTPEILNGFSKAIDLIPEESRVVVVTGNGRCFSAGADFNSQIQAGSETLQAHERSYEMYRSFLKLLDVQVPVIGALNGHAVGGGFGLSLLCDLRVGNKDAKYGANFVRLGLHPGLGISYTLPRTIGHQKAAELLLTGRLFLGSEGRENGYLLEAVAASQVLGKAMDIAKQVATAAPAAVRMTKKTFRKFQAWDVHQAAHDEAFAQAASVNTADFKEGVSALLEKREPKFTGS